MSVLSVSKPICFFETRQTVPHMTTKLLNETANQNRVHASWRKRTGKWAYDEYLRFLHVWMNHRYKCGWKCTVILAFTAFQCAYNFRTISPFILQRYCKNSVGNLDLSLHTNRYTNTNCLKTVLKTTLEGLVYFSLVLHLFPKGYYCLSTYCRLHQFLTIGFEMRLLIHRKPSQRPCPSVVIQFDQWIACRVGQNDDHTKQTIDKLINNGI